MRKALRHYLEIAKSNRHDTSLLLFAVAGFVGLLQAKFQGVSWGHGFEMIRIAQNIADHGAFADPFGVLNTGPTAANPPMYPLMLAVLIKVLNNPALVALAATIGNILANAVTAALLPYVSFHFFEEVSPGIVAALLWMGSMQLLPSWDTSYTVAGLLALCLITGTDCESKQLARRGICAGCIAGFVYLLNPSTILIVLPWFIYLFIRGVKVATRPAVIYFSVLLVTFSLFPVAWATRNHHVLGGYVTRTNLGMTLYSSNNDCAQSSLVKNEANNCYQEHHPNTSLDEAMRLRNLGEIPYDRTRIADSTVWIYSRPQRFSQLTLQRFREFWFPPRERPFAYQATVISLITLLSLPGLFLMLRRRRPITLFVLSGLFLYPLIYYIVVSDTRYRYPVLWLSLLPAGYFVSKLFGAENHPRVPGTESQKVMVYSSSKCTVTDPPTRP
jgi:hypothetical protein